MALSNKSFLPAFVYGSRESFYPSIGSLLSAAGFTGAIFDLRSVKPNDEDLQGAIRAVTWGPMAHKAALVSFPQLHLIDFPSPESIDSLSVSDKQTLLSRLVSLNQLLTAQKASLETAPLGIASLEGLIPEVLSRLRKSLEARGQSYWKTKLKDGRDMTVTLEPGDCLKNGSDITISFDELITLLEASRLLGITELEVLKS